MQTSNDKERRGKEVILPRQASMQAMDRELVQRWQAGHLAAQAMIRELSLATTVQERFADLCSLMESAGALGFEHKDNLSDYTSSPWQQLKKRR